ncbi:RNA polymerase II associated protein 2 [Homalodisca vitripennis]|nr:RNA polymerase II associated protein 2 [Homalodisca vitripennis]
MTTKSLGLKGFNFSDEVRTLIGTFILSAHNITMKPGEWNLIAIVIIKLLSLKDKSLEQALGSSSTSKHLTLLLMSYSLDAGYLDRLIVWLTDIESVIQKLK